MKEHKRSGIFIIVFIMFFCCSLLSVSAQEEPEEQPEVLKASRAQYGTNISVDCVQRNASQGSMPSGTTNLIYNESYYFNMCVTEDMYLKSGTLYIYKNGNLYDTNYYEASGYFRWRGVPYNFTETGNYSYRWDISTTDGRVFNLQEKTFTVSYDVSISFSKTGMSFTYGDTGVTNTVTISGNGVSTVAYGISNNQIVSARWGNWNQGNIPLTITPKAAGSTTVWVDAKDKNGHVITSKSFQVTVNKASPRLSFASSSLHKTYGTGSFTNTLTKTTDGTISYSSSDTSIASVNSAGMVTINRAGSCTITATASSGNNYTSGSSRYTLTVDKAFPSMSFANSSITKTYGDGAFCNSLTTNTDGTISYSSSNTSIASVNSSGLVTIHRAGKCTITATASSGNNYLFGDRDYTLTISKASPSMKFAISSITKTYGDGAFRNSLTTNTDGTISYSSSNTGIASVNNDGMVTIHRAGSCIIMASALDGTNYTGGSIGYKLTVVPEKDATHTEDQDALESSNIPDSQDSDSSNKDTGSNIQSGGNSIPLPYAAFQKIKPSVSARIAGANKIKISWKKISGAQKYSIFYTASPKKGYRFLKTVSGASYTASKLKTKRTYYFKVKASVVVNGRTINTDYSNAISKKAVGKPPKPKLKAKVSGNMLVLKWRKLSGVKNIVVYRSVNNGKYKAIRQVSGKSSSCKLSIANYSRAKSYRFFIKSYYLKDGVKIWSSDSKCRVLRGK